MPLVWGLTGPEALPPGSLYSAVMGTAVTFSAGLAVAYAGLGVQNPANSGVRIVPMRASFAPTGTAVGTSACPWGIMKLTAGTAALGTLSGFAGVITSPGVVGTATGKAVVFGTCTVLNGTAGPGPNALNWVAICGGFTGTGTGVSAGFAVADLAGEACAMPGETLMICVNQGVVGLAGLVWTEVPLGAG